MQAMMFARHEAENMTETKVRKGSGNYTSADPKETLRANWDIAVRITRPLAKPEKPAKPEPPRKL